MGSGTGQGITSLGDARKANLTGVTSDRKVGRSVITFETEDTKSVLVLMRGGNDDYRDGIRKGRGVPRP